MRPTAPEPLAPVAARRRSGIALGTLLACLSATPARAASSCDGSRPWVQVVFERGEWTSGFERAVLNDLDAGLLARGIAACDSSSGERPPSAVVTLTGQAGSDVNLSVEVSDTVTHKRVGRDVDLGSVPSDGRAFALALAIDELVWATWAELALDPERERHQEAPPEVVEAVERELPRAEPAPSPRLGARAAGEHFTAELTQLGADALFLAPLSPRFALEFAAGVRLGSAVQAPHGELRSRALGVASALRYELWASEALALDFGLGLRALLVQFRGTPEAGAGARDFTDLAVDARGLGYVRLPLFEPLSLELGAGVGTALRTVVPTDAGEAVGGVRGLQLLASLGVLVEL